MTTYVTRKYAMSVARAIAAAVGRDVYVIRDEEGEFLLSWIESSKANGTQLIGAPEDVREDVRGFYLHSTGERIGQ